MKWFLLMITMWANGDRTHEVALISNINQCVELREAVEHDESIRAPNVVSIIGFCEDNEDKVNAWRNLDEKTKR